jgi:ABC-2 type transport system ATP-binding protein
MAERIAIHVYNLSKTYHHRKGEAIEAVRNVNLAIPAGQVFGFLGPNGAGKTTTIKMICTLITPTSGSVTLNGIDVARKHRSAMLQTGAVLEGTRNVHWALSAWDNLLYFGHLKGMVGSPLRSRAEWLLKELDLWDRRCDLVRTFSRGMQQKVAIASALINDPPIILLDEPTLGLDVQASRVVKTLVTQLVQDYGKTVVLTTHQLDMAQDLCQQVAIISKGRIIADQPVEDLLDIFDENYYRIIVRGDVLTGMDLVDLSRAVENGNTVLTGPIADQEALYALLNKIHNMGLTLISASRIEPDLEEVFVRLLDRDAGLQAASA